MKTIHLDIVTPDGSAFSGDVESVVIPAWEGQMGILPGREPIIAVLNAGELRYRHDGKEELMAVSGGFAQVDHKKIVVLAETAELARQIDEARAKAKAEEKQQALKGVSQVDEGSIVAMQASLLKELIRIKVAEKYRKG
jgi:F-type H+-transporting ATPase subunit epsilon